MILLLLVKNGHKSLVTVAHFLFNFIIFHRFTTILSKLTRYLIINHLQIRGIGPAELMLMLLLIILISLLTSQNVGIIAPISCLLCC